MNTDITNKKKDNLFDLSQYRTVGLLNYFGPLSAVTDLSDKTIHM